MSDSWAWFWACIVLAMPVWIVVAYVIGDTIVGAVRRHK